MRVPDPMAHDLGLGSDKLAHGWKGILEEHAERFGVKSQAAAIEMVRLAALKKRMANKSPCPCGSGRRLGKCHNRKVNECRAKLGRHWFRRELKSLAVSLGLNNGKGAVNA